MGDHGAALSARRGPSASVMCLESSERFPAQPGTYALVLLAAEPLSVRVGHLGEVLLSPGYYVYVGSAQGSGGLRARIARHLRPAKRIHWHIDALTAALPVIEVAAMADARRLECDWVRRLLGLRGSSVPVAGFGSSDCRAGCPAHLVRLADVPNAQDSIDEQR